MPFLDESVGAAASLLCQPIHEYQLRCQSSPNSLCHQSRYVIRVSSKVAIGCFAKSLFLFQTGNRTHIASPWRVRNSYGSHNYIHYELRAYNTAMRNPSPVTGCLKFLPRPLSLGCWIALQKEIWYLLKGTHYFLLLDMEHSKRIKLSVSNWYSLLLRMSGIQTIWLWV